MNQENQVRRTRRAVAVGVGALVALVAGATLAGATEYTGWQTNDGWNSLEGCRDYRDIRSDGVLATDGNLCGGDVGVKGQFYYGVTVYLTPWDWDYRAAGWIDPTAD